MIDRTDEDDELDALAARDADEGPPCGQGCVRACCVPRRVPDQSWVAQRLAEASKRLAPVLRPVVPICSTCGDRGYQMLEDERHQLFAARCRRCEPVAVPTGPTLRVDPPPAPKPMTAKMARAGLFRRED